MTLPPLHRVYSRMKPVKRKKCVARRARYGVLLQ